jgi:hypothetical protein
MAPPLEFGVVPRGLTGVPGGVDGAFPRADEALVRGVLSAAEAKHATGATAAIGFAAALDYAGLDVYADVFGPRVGVARVAEVVGWLLRAFREQTLPIAGVPASTPVRICENGWPTGPGRPEDRQALVLEATLRAVHALRAELDVTHWELFTLRDADSSKDDMFYRFGVLRDLMAELRRA